MKRKPALPKITIVTPSFNQAHFIEETINSVLSQNYPNLEYIIIDGGSKDNTINIIKKYEKYLSYWISEPDKGQSDAINKGFHRSTGDILHWLNSDDLLVPGALQTIAEYFMNNPDIGCVIGDQEVIDEKGNTLMVRKVVPFHFRTALFTASLVPQPSAPFTREAWLKTGDLDITLQYQMDFEYYLRMAKKGVKFGIIPKTLSKFRIHSDSKTISGYSDKVKKANIEIQKRYLNNKLFKSRFSNELLNILNFIYKGKVFLQRAFLRGDAVPLRRKRAAKRLKS